MPFEIVRNDITQVKVDAIVNAANTALQRGGGVCGAIFNAAGANELQKACDKIGGCETGKAVITSGFKLKAKYIIHAVGPIWSGGGEGERELLYSCYKNALLLAKENNIESIAFPLISSGIYGYPKEEALQVAVEAIEEFLQENDIHIKLVVFDKASFSISQKRHDVIKEYINENYVEEHIIIRGREHESAVFASSKNALPTQAPTMQTVCEGNPLDYVLSRLEETFSERLLRIIDERGYSDSQVYKRANIDRRVFSKIRSNKNYQPSKNTAIAFAVALKLNLDDTRDLLMAAGYALSRSNKADVIIEYFIRENNYNIFEINEALFAFDQNLLGA